jgi:CheY-like chemotaxis protein
VVDDDQDTLRLYRMRLEIDGHCAFTASSGGAALEIFAAEEIDVAFIDLMMPEMDGYELCSKLRKLAGGASVELYALTGLCRRREEQAALAAGFDGYLLKPVPYRKLAQILAGQPERSTRRPASRKRGKPKGTDAPRR